MHSAWPMVYRGEGRLASRTETASLWETTVPVLDEVPKRKDAIFIYYRKRKPNQEEKVTESKVWATYHGRRFQF